MNLSGWKIYVVIVVVAVSMVGLMAVQMRLFKEDVDLYKQQFNLRVPELIDELQGSLRNDHELINAVNHYEGREEFVIQSFEGTPDSQILKDLKSRIDGLFLKNGLNVDYEVSGVIASDTRCFYYIDDETRHAHPFITEVIDSENFMCLCGPSPGQSHGHHGAGRYTAFDISIGYPNQLGYFIGSNGPLMLTSLLFLLLILGAFAYTVVTINRQKKLSVLKNDFINNMTHEFKTPIFSISLASGLLRKSDEVKGSDKLTKYAELIDNEGKRLKSQVDKVLQMALVDSGNFKLEKRSLDVHELIRKVARSFELMITERGGSLKLELTAINHEIYADETHLNNLLYNLLDNAQKYTEKQPEIVVRTYDSESGLALSIKDNGIGIGAEVQRFVFDKFYRAETGDIHDVKGFGLGLSYVKSVVEAHRGKISLRSEKNAGSEFLVQLPLA